MKPHLSDIIKIKRRYSRSVNLERDQDIADSVKGYILSPHIITLASRFFSSIGENQSVRAWTLTGVYGTGKSAFAHFLLALCSPSESPIRRNAERLLKETTTQLLEIKGIVPDRGFIKAIATAQREPILNTLLRALRKGSENYWQGVRGARPKAVDRILVLENKIKGNELIDNREVLQVIQELAVASKAGIVIVIDELGKNLEYVSQNQDNNDLYLLQQLAEMPSGSNAPKVFFLGLLHQSFSDYAHSLTLAQKNEWSKVQGRFEDIPFSESSERMLHLIGNAIEQHEPNKKFPGLKKQSKSWQEVTSEFSVMRGISSEDIASVFPFHPFAAYVLPLLCNKYSQNDRTLFTFLSSNEPHSFTSFLNETAYDKATLPSLKLYHLYDYFIESAGLTSSSLAQFQKWGEIQGRISDANGLSLDYISVLKTIDILNLVSNTGSLRASRRFVALALCDGPNNPEHMSRHENIVDELIKKGFITWRKQIDELRIWEGTDFDIESMFEEQLQQIRLPLAQMLNEYYPLRPIIANRHSYVSGTLRYFERMYVDRSNQEKLISAPRNYDGRICYWVDSDEYPKKLPELSEDGKPIVLLSAYNLDALSMACHEYVAFNNIEKNAVQLQTDGVARREVKQRQFLAKKVLEDAIVNSFDFKNRVECVIGGSALNIHNDKGLNTKLSDLCDSVYPMGLYLWNELINKREITSQAVKARRELSAAMLKNIGKKNLGIEGYGPEFCMFQSLLNETGIYAYVNNSWMIQPPRENSGVYDVWKKIEGYCLSAVETPEKMSVLYDELEKPPYGVRQGAVPILLLSVLLYHSDYLSIYYDGTYVPVLSAEHFELLMRKPQKFSIKYIDLKQLQISLFVNSKSIVFTNLIAKTLPSPTIKPLFIANALMDFVKRLPTVVMKTEKMGVAAVSIRGAILRSNDPVKLFYDDLPFALGISGTYGGYLSTMTVQDYLNRLDVALIEIEKYYNDLLAQCEMSLSNAFSISNARVHLRDDLRRRSNYIKNDVIDPMLKRFIMAVLDAAVNDRKWLESLLMVIADKPVESWTDEDAISFDSNLSIIAKKVCQLEAMHQPADAQEDNLRDALRITLTKKDGYEINELLWLDKCQRDEIRTLAKNILADNLKGHPSLRKAVLVELIDTVFANQPTEAPC